MDKQDSTTIRKNVWVTEIPQKLIQSSSSSSGKSVIY